MNLVLRKLYEDTWAKKRRRQDDYFYLVTL